MQKRQRGQSLDISARDWNRTIDAHNAHRVGLAGDFQRGIQRTDYVWVKNTLSRDLNRFAACLIGDPTPSALNAGKDDVVFELVNGSLVSQSNNYRGGDPVVGILPEPIAAGRIGQAQISGVALAAFRWDDNYNGSNMNGYAVMSDRDDKLAFSSFGSVRVLQRDWTVNSALNNYVIPVDLGHPQTLGVCFAGLSISTWQATPNNVYAGSVSLGGDTGRVGLYGVATTPPSQAMPLKLGRTGAYRVTVHWSALFSASGLANADRLEWRVNWGDARTQYGGFCVKGWTGSGSYNDPFNMVTGHREFLHLCEGTGVASAVQIPGFEARTINNSTGVGTAITSSGEVRVEVVRLGSFSSTDAGFWDDGLRASAWARGSTAGPI